MGNQFDEALLEAKALADRLMACVGDETADATTVMACCILIHRLEPSGEHLASFAQRLLSGRAWVNEEMETT